MSHSTPRNNGSVVDVNFANVHELMVVGFSPEQAEAVVWYRVARRQHFASKEEIRNIPQIDETTWLRVKPRITLIPSSGLVAAARATSGDGVFHEVLDGEIPACESGTTKGGAMVDLNTSNYRQLCVIGLSESQSLAVINHRVRNGKFSSIDAIRNVPSISEADYQRVKSRLTLTPGLTPSHSSRNSSAKKGRGSTSSRNLQAGNVSPVHQLSNSLSELKFVDHQVGEASLSGYATPQKWQQPKSTDEGAHNLTGDSFTITGISSPSSIKSPSFPQIERTPKRSGSKPSGRTVRVASWNLQRFDEKKADNPAVLEVVCSTILQHG